MSTTYSVTNTFAADTSAVATQVNTNFTDVLAALNSFDASNLSSGTLPLARIAGLTTTQFAANVIDTDGTLAANSDTRIASQKAGKTYTDTTVAASPTTWITWTPTLTQGVSVTFTTTRARYVQLGKITFVLCHITATSAGTVGQTITVGNLPVDILGSPRSLGSGTVTDTGFVAYPADVQRFAASDVLFAGFAQGNAIGTTPRFALASGDIISFMITYETA